MLLWRSVEPIWSWRITDPGVRHIDMVGDSIEEHFYVFFMRGLHKLLVFLQRSEVRINRIQIDRAITLRILGRPILQNRCELQRSHPKLLEVPQVIANPT